MATTAAAIKERPILFSGPMVRAILEGRKTQTRRVVKPQPQPLSSCAYDVGGVVVTDPDEAVSDHILHNTTCPYGWIGERLWVRETFDWIVGKVVSIQGGVTESQRLENTRYRADGGDPVSCQWTPSIHMPRWLSRITLEITDVRVQRLQEIKNGDAAAEGLIRLPASGRYVINQGDQYFGGASHDPREVFQLLWGRIHKEDGPSGWLANPWVWAITFKRV